MQSMRMVTPDFYRLVDAEVEALNTNDGKGVGLVIRCENNVTTPVILTYQQATDLIEKLQTAVQAV
jgi:hypothetical protein